MIFGPPYMSFDPFPFQSGSPRVSIRGRPDLGTLSFFLETNRTAPSETSVLTSLGMVVGFPRLESGAPIAGPSELVVSPLFDFSGFFWFGGSSAWAMTSSSVQVFVEEFGGDGSFRSFIQGTLPILHEDAYWVAGSREFAPAGRGRSTPVDQRIFARPDASYVVWLDLLGGVRGAGFGFGGSGAIAQMFVMLPRVDVRFSPLR